MRLYKSFNDIILENKPFFEKLQNLNNIYAHIHEKKESETLFEHTKLVLKYFIKLIKVHNLEGIIDKLINSISLDNQIIGEYTKKLFLNSLLFHDIGKININFQLEKMNNTLYNQEFEFDIGSEHSYLSTYIFLNFNINEIYRFLNVSNEYKNILVCYSFLFTIPILKHHSSIIEKDYEYDIEKINSIHEMVNIFSLDFDLEKNFIKKFIENEKRLWDFFDDYIKEKKFDFFSLFALLKLNWSLLTASDYYATFEYMNDIEINDFGIIDENLRQKIYDNFIKSKTYNKDLIEKIDYYLSINPKELNRSPDNLNILRQRLSAEVWKNTEKYKKENIFYIEAPTGGGKTNLSLVAVRKLLELNPEINKVFYVFPFTTLITQTLKTIEDTFGLSIEHIAEVHSKASFIQKKEINEEDAFYGDQYKNQIDNLFINFPFVLITHIKFFDILKSNKKKSNYLLHRLANSIVVIDEIQAYNPEHWDKIKYFISNYARYFNIKFIIMSATLPKLHNIVVSKDEFLKFNELIENPQESYFKNPNFCERTYINTDFLEYKELSLDFLAWKVYEISEKYAIDRADNYKGSVFTIIEFIFKKTATEFYDLVIKNNFFKDYEIFVLSGTIIEPRRKFIIEYLKDPFNRRKKILVISTQVVEAGVDIDMDIGFKNQSLLDSDEQLAGRINRNLEKDNGILWLFKYNEPSKIYGKDLRYKVIKELKKEEIKKILQEKDFNKFYEQVMEKINMNNESVYKKNFYDYKNYIALLCFSEIDSEFKLIDDETVSIFVPANIPINCYKKTKNFSLGELKFLEYYGFYNSGDEFVSGEKIWELYISLVNGKRTNILNKNLTFKVLYSILSKFVFSIFKSKIEDLKPFLEFNEDVNDYRVYNFFKLKSTCIGVDKIYSIEGGLNEKLLKNPYEII